MQKPKTDPRRNPGSVGLSDGAKDEIDTAIAELDRGSCRTFSNIKELIDDLDSD
jgi:hypothetical protein